MRFKNTERLGVIEAEKVITKDIQWIFREQPVIDVGIDAIIEEVQKNDPTGRLIAAQIKSGNSNFNMSKNYITLYVSNVHRNYWLGYVLPVILIAYLPDTNTLLWQIISDETLKKTKNKWKIDIPYNRTLDIHSKSELIEVLDSKFKFVVNPVTFIGDPNTINVFSLVENIGYINDATNSTKRFIDIMAEMSITADKQTIKIKQFSARGLSFNDRQVSASMNKFALELKVFAKRINNEIMIFAESFGIGISAYWQVTTTYYSLTNDESVLFESKESINTISLPLKSAITAISGMRQSINQLPKLYPNLKVAKNFLVSAIDLVLDEYQTAQDFLNSMNNEQTTAKK